ncbi:DUF3078 domain-containing protein [Niabella sp. CC-SYL272]|uniref:DUF3078 domain-containing protein n=1 Tax=Niabella agricola TaxID=2891571 RepID=UPI001F41FA3C|nr:DUF3078 domain-containing protein [Niabella agricola]MCF3110736.1 DUF3078 domain-containing protein [Niabella agricola]
MRKLLLFALLLNAGFCLHAQDETVKKLQADSDRKITKDPNDTAQMTWKTGGVFNLNIAQGSLSNWSAGGDKFSLALNSLLSTYAFYQKGKHHWDNTLDLNLGYMNTTSLGTRKNDDRIDLVSKYAYDIGKKWDVGALFNFRSQILKGYDYTDSSKTLTSQFLSPAYVLLSPGVTYKPTKNFSIFVSPVTARWTVVMNDSLSARGAYGVDTGKHVRTEFGAFATVNFFKEFSKSISFKSRADFYSNYLHNPQNIDVYWTNLLSMKLGKLFAINYALDLIYDDDARLFGPEGKSARPQIRSMLGIGLSYRFSNR